MTTKTRVATAAAAVGLLVALAGCSSAGDSEPSSSGGGSGTNTDSTITAEFIQTLRDGIPGTTDIPDLEGVEELAGKTFTYIPIIQAAPNFTPTIEGLRDATEAMGVKLQVCDGGANPSQISTCLIQAAQNKDAAVITDSFPKEFAQQGFTALADAGVPLVFSNDSASEPTALEATVGADFGSVLTTQQAQWAINDSDGTANVLMLKVTDSATTVGAVENGSEKVFAEECPGCTVTVVEVSSAQMSQVSSLVSSALITNPDIDYVFPQYDGFVSSVVTALQTMNSSDIQVVGGTGILQVMQLIEAGTYVSADVATAAYESGWQMADQAARLALGVEAVPDYVPSTRLFDETNIGSVDLSDDAVNSGSWFGVDDLRERYGKVWGID